MNDDINFRDKILQSFKYISIPRFPDYPIYPIYPFFRYLPFMKNKVVYTLLILLFLACSRTEKPEESVPDRPDAEDFRREQPELQQDTSPDPRLDSDSEQRLAPDLTHSHSSDLIEAPAGFTTEGVFTGTLPCADCTGIQMELRLFRNLQNDHRRYVLKSTYLGTRDGDKLYWDAGPWTELTSAENRRILRLSQNSPTYRRSFEVSTNRVIRLLDRDENPIESQHNYSLYRLPQ